jgi:uncharacterized protein YciI
LTPRRAGFGGSMIDEASITAEKKNVSGSTVFIRADSLADVRKLVEADPYYTAGVVSPPTHVWRRMR